MRERTKEVQEIKERLSNKLLILEEKDLTFFDLRKKDLKRKLQMKIMIKKGEKKKRNRKTIT